MEKIAVIEIKTTSVQLKLIDMVTNKYYQPSRTIEMPINLIKDFYTDIDDTKNQLFAKEGDWILNPSNDALNLLPDYFHKATVEEILQYFS